MTKVPGVQIKLWEGFLAIGRHTVDGRACGASVPGRRCARNSSCALARSNRQARRNEGRRTAYREVIQGRKNSKTRSGTYARGPIRTPCPLSSPLHTTSKGDPITIPIKPVNLSPELWEPDAHEFKYVVSLVWFIVLTRSRRQARTVGKHTRGRPTHSQRVEPPHVLPLRPPSRHWLPSLALESRHLSILAPRGPASACMLLPTSASAACSLDRRVKQAATAPSPCPRSRSQTQQARFRTRIRA